MAGKIRDKRIGAALGWALVSLVVVAVMLGGAGDSVEARKYGHRYKKYNYAARIARCKAGCNRTAGSLRACAGRNSKSAIRNCKNAFKGNKADCAGDGQCNVLAKQALKQCVASARGGASAGNKYLHTEARACGRCCQRTRGGGSCTGYFQGNRWYGAYKRYGRLQCPQPGSPSAAFLDVSGRIRHGLARLVPWAVDGWTD